MNPRSYLVTALAGTCALSSAFAGGGQAKLSPFGVPYSDTVTLHCQSGRSIVYFVPNTQSTSVLYRGKESKLVDLPNNRDIRYSDVGLMGMGEFEHDQLGEGLELHDIVSKSGKTWLRHDLYRVVQHANGKRTLTLLERCKG